MLNHDRYSEGIAMDKTPKNNLHSRMMVGRKAGKVTNLSKI